MLPDTVGRYSLTKISLAGERFIPTAGEEFAQLVESLNVDPAELSVATASAASPDGSENVATIALRMPGTTADQLIAAYSTAVETSEGDVDITPDQIGGKTVFSMSGGALTQPAYFYAIDDVFFIVTASGEALAADALGQLP